MLLNLTELVDVTHAEATNPADKVRILQQVEDGPGGADGLNVVVRGVVNGAYWCSDKRRTPVQAAVCGDWGMLNSLLEVGDEVLLVLDARRDAHEVVGQPARRAHVRGDGRVRHEARQRDERRRRAERDRHLRST